jgi:hypothetical protein
MSCTSVSNYARQCNKGIAGGIQKLYIVGFGDLKNISGSTDVFAFSSGTTIVNQISFVSGKTFAEVGLLTENASFTNTVKRDVSNGSVSGSQETKLTINNMSETAKQYIDLLLMQPVAILIKLRSGNFIVNGLNGYTYLSQVDEGSGTKGADLNGYALIFTGISEGLTATVDPVYALSIITSN